MEMKTKQIDWHKLISVAGAAHLTGCKYICDYSSSRSPSHNNIYSYVRSGLAVISFINIYHRIFSQVLLHFFLDNFFIMSGESVAPIKGGN